MALYRSTINSLIVAVTFLLGFGLGFGIPATASAKLEKVTLMRPWEIRRLESAERLEYYRAIQSFLVQLENATNDGSPRDRNAWLNWLLPPANAYTVPDTACLMGGYMSQWKLRETGRVHCAAPAQDKMFDVTTGKKDFYCGSAQAAGDSRRAQCNSAFFLYGNDSGARHCEVLRDFGASCRDAFDSRYGRGGDPNFPERLNRDFERFARILPPEEMEKKLRQFETELNLLTEQSALDEKTATSLERQIAAIDALKERSTAAARRQPELADPVLPPPSASAPFSTSGSVAVRPPPRVTVFHRNRPQPTPTPKASPSKDEANNSEKPDTNPATSGASQAAPSSSLLGPELSCVRDGLIKMGYDPSELFLALIATGVQASGSPYDTRQEHGRTLLRSRVISMVQSYGFCDEKSYSSRHLKARERRLLRRWMTADGGRAKAKRGISYLDQMSDRPGAKDEALNSLKTVFDLPPETGASESPSSDLTPKAFSIFTQDEKSWSESQPHQRQRHIHGWKSDDTHAKRRFAACHRQSQERREKEDAFRLEALRMPPLSRDGRRPPIGEKEKMDRSKVAQANQAACEAMAKSCGLESTKLCAISVPGVSPSRSNISAPAQKTE